MDVADDFYEARLFDLWKRESEIALCDTAFFSPVFLCKNEVNELTPMFKVLGTSFGRLIAIVANSNRRGGA